MINGIRNQKSQDRLLEKGILNKEDDHFLFAKDYEFTSPSLAAAAVCGGTTNGLTQWRTKEGKTLKELERE